MGATIMTLRDEAGNPVAPRTSANAVMTEGGISVEAALQQIGQGGGGSVAPEELAKKVSKSGDTMTGDLTLRGDPTADLHAATKQYVDNAVANGGSGIVELPGTLTYWSENESIEFGDITTPADTVKMASGKTLESVLAGCWIEFADKDGNPTTEPYIHWYAAAPEIILISFTVEGTSYQAEEGMTWAEWIESDYNTSSFIINSEGSVKTATGSHITYNGSGILVGDMIIADREYGQVTFP